MIRIQKMLKKWFVVALSISINCGTIFSYEAPCYYLPRNVSIASISQMRFEKMKKIILRFKGQNFEQWLVGDWLLFENTLLSSAKKCKLNEKVSLITKSQTPIWRLHRGSD